MKYLSKISVVIVLIGFLGLNIAALNPGLGVDGMKVIKKSDQTGTVEFTVDDFRVILKPTQNEVISARLYVEGGTTNYTKEMEGIETLAFQVASVGGTQNFPKEKYNTMLERLGTNISGSSTYDYGNMSMTCVLRNWDKSWNIFKDVIMHPTFDPAELELEREKLITAAKNSKSDPDTYLRKMALQAAFTGGNYAKVTDGSEESLASISHEAMVEYYSDVMNKGKCFLVVVGKVSMEDLAEKVKMSLARLPKGKIKKKDKTPLDFSSSSIMKEQRDIATNYMRGMLPAPAQGSKESYAMSIAMDILSDRFFEEIRTKRGLTYATFANYPISILYHPYNFIYVSTVEPDQVAQVMIDLLREYRDKGFDSKKVEYKKGEFLTRYFMGQETNASQSVFLGNSTLMGDWMLAEKYLDNVNSVSVEAVNAVYKKYIKAVKWAYLGDVEKVTDKIFTQTL